MSLGKRLKAEREKRGWSQIYVAKKIGITNAVLSNYERDYRDPDTETLKKLAELYEVSTDWLLGRTNDPQGTVYEYNEYDKKFLEFKEMWESLSEKEQQHLIDLAKTFYELKKELKSRGKNER